MSSTQERIKKRREYLKRKGGAYAKISWSAFLTGLLTVMLVVVIRTTGPARIALTVFYWSYLLVVLIHSAHKTHQAVKKLPYVPPVTADTLPAEEVLVRGSEEPVQKQSKVLLRGTQSGLESAEQELLRSSQGQEE